MSAGQIWIGCAGWTIPSAVRAQFPEAGTHLERYAQRFPSVEINSSFYRPHRPATYARWADSVPDEFRFSVKMPKAITHDSRLENVAPLLETFLDEYTHLGPKLGYLLIQLPPSLAWNKQRDVAFFKLLRGLTDVPACCEPRHATWFADDVSQVLEDYQITRVIADPSRQPHGNFSAPASPFAYYRLHGSPRMYYSNYEPAFLTQLADELRQHAQIGHDVWCIFDNTAAGHAASNALDLLRLLARTELDRKRPALRSVP